MPRVPPRRRIEVPVTAAAAPAGLLSDPLSPELVLVSPPEIAMLLRQQLPDFPTPPPRIASRRQAGALELAVVYLFCLFITVDQLLVSGGDESAGPVSTTPSPGTGTTFVTVSRASNIAVLDLRTGRIRLVTDSGGRYLAVSSPAWSPDGRRIAFARQECPHCPFRITVSAADGSSAKPLRGWLREGNEPAWSPDGGQLVFATTEGVERELVLFDLHRAHGRALDLHGDEGGGGEEEVESPNHPAFSPDGLTVAFEAETERERTRIFLLDLPSGELREVESEADHNAYPAFSPTGQRLVFSRTDARYAWNVCEKTSLCPVGEKA